MEAPELIHFTTGRCALGELLVAQSAQGICAILLGDDTAALQAELTSAFPKANVQQDKLVQPALAEVKTFIEHPQQGLVLPLDIRGTEFQRRVWQALQQIPPGTTASYTQVAHQLHKPTAFRAVAQACAANVLAVAIPCHRVLRSDGGLSGYRWGVERKKSLLQQERSAK